MDFFVLNTIEMSVEITRVSTRPGLNSPGSQLTRVSTKPPWWLWWFSYDFTFFPSLKKYYAKKSKQDKAMFSEKLKKVQDDDAVKKKAQQQQDSIIEMMKMQMRDAQERADKQLEEALNRPKSASSVATDPEIYDLREEVEKLENKLDDMMNQLEDRENENRRLGESI